MARPFIIPIFISHQGCPHQCVFCNQHSITGRAESQAVTPAEVIATIEEQLAWPRKRKKAPVQVAFYGGSFTALAAEYQESLLQAAHPFLSAGLVQEIRLSTRPDAVDNTVIERLIRYGVKIVELGVQSLDGHVLQKSGRGHDCNAVLRAARLVKESGLRLGMQLMVGLPGETTCGLLDSAHGVIDLAPDFIRIYPTLVIKDSPLAQLFAENSYRPLSLNKAVALAARLTDLFEEKHIPVIRLGLQAGESLEQDLVAGPYHPAFGELVRSRVFFKKIKQALSTAEPGAKTLSLSQADESLFRGQANCNFKRLTDLGLLEDVQLHFNAGQPRQAIRLVSN